MEDSIRSLFITDWTDYSTNDNGKCVSTLLHTNNWTGFVNASYSDYAIGGPTLEMWVASYNAKGYDKLYCNNTNSYGHYIGNEENPTSTYYGVTNDENNGYNDTLYFPHQNKVDGMVCGYLLATPSAEDPGSLMFTEYVGALEGSDFNSLSNFLIVYETAGVRPLVSLKSTVTAKQDENGIWKLSN